ncbi:MAG: chloride channel protein [Proteobacteria bacterium]|nr:chloride channel protein [Pseudomonadota bacterium]
MDDLRINLSQPDALIQLAFLGLISGLISGIIIVAFRLLVESSQIVLLQGIVENFEVLSLEQRVIYPVVGSIFIALLFRYFSKGIRVLGIARVIESMALSQGYLSLRGFFLQFFGAAIAIISGHSVGREGPIVFLGAASSSLLGQSLRLPNNSIRTLVGCGTAAGIAASFDTPLAGVIFALEVVMMEYTMVSFVPVIIAAVSATWVSVFFFGHEPPILSDIAYEATLSDLPLVILLGIIAGIFSALFVHLIQLISTKTQQINFSAKLISAGFIVGLIAMIEPGVMGVGYDSLVQIVSANILLDSLLLLLMFKLLATVACLGLGIPGGVVGPALFLGASLGGVFALIIRLFFPEFDAVNISIYSMLGMGAVMGASLQAPLAALIAMMELTRMPEVILPGMITIVIANLTASEIFHKKSLFISMLESNGIDITANPVTQSLRRIGVASVMNRSILQTGPMITIKNLNECISNETQWLIIDAHEDEIEKILALGDLVLLSEQYKKNSTDELIDLNLNLEHDIGLSSVTSIHLQATLEEALNKMNHFNINMLYVRRVVAPGRIHIYGIVTREQIEASYH